jgi:hypothetical protein
MTMGLTAMLSAPTSVAPMRYSPAYASIESGQASWTQVLKRHVDTAGRIDFTRLARDRAELDRVVESISVHDPTTLPARFPTVNSQLAYYINAYNALAMYGVLEAGVPTRFGWFARVRFFYLRKFSLGGHATSLYSLENEIIRPLGEPRVHFALNCMTVSCPRLPQSAFTAEGLDRELNTAARQFINDDRNVRVDGEKREVRLSAIFDFYMKDFLANSPSLIAYVNRYRVEPVPPDYKVVFADYDWTINDQPRFARQHE